MKKLFVFIVACATTFPLLAQQRMKVEPFPMTDVHLLPSRFQENFKRDSAWMMSIPVTSLVHSFQTTAGVFAGREGGYMTVKKFAGWESMDCDLRGHITGHLLSALATLYAQTGSAAVKAKADSIVDALNVCQQALGTGYLSAFPEGLIDRNIRGEGVWAPWYTLHKILQGLIDQATLCHNDTARAMALRMGEWAYCKTEDLDEATRRRMIRNEFGGFNEAMYCLSSPNPSKGGDVDMEKESERASRALTVARFFYHNEKVDPLKAGNNDLGTNHANTFIPKLLGEARNYELTGDTTSRRAAELLFRTLAYDHAFVTGEVSDKEHLFRPEEQAKHLSAYDGENCCTFNLLKLADHVFCWQPDSRVADYYERALYNHILGQQDPETSMVCYFTPLQSGAYRLYSTRDSSFWCCVGSGFESHVKYASSIYFHNDRDLYVNLFIPSRVEWGGTTITQQTRFPEDGTTMLTIGGQKRRFTLQLRHPQWATSMTVKVNGKAMKATTNSDGYVAVTRQWRPGDKVTVSYGMDLHKEYARGDSARYALLRGPIVMAGRLDSVAYPFSNPKAYNDYYTFDYHVPTGFDRLTPKDVPLIPFYDAHHCRYIVYWNR